MAKSNKLTAQERKDLESVGWVEGNPSTIPDNISPVLRSKIQEAYAEDNGIDNPLDLPTAVERQNALARERAEAEEDGVDTKSTRQNKAASE